MDNILCLKWGTLYSAEYVNRLHRGVKAHLHRPFRFVCVTDDPSGLVATAKANHTAKGTYSPTVGGATGSASDPAGYQGATGAIQSFMFTITEYNSDGTTATGKVITDYLSFSAGETEKYLIFKIDRNKVYKVKEDVNWSWKYKLTDIDVTEDVADDASNKNSVTFSASDQAGSYATVKAYNTPFTFTPAGGSEKTLNRTAQVTFDNDKNSDKSTVEGDTDVKDNAIPVPAA